MNSWDEEMRREVLARIPLVEGMRVVNLGSFEAGEYCCRRIHDLQLDEDSFLGQCDWGDPPQLRPDELTEGMAISCDCLRLGSGWWQDTYFGWYFVYDPELVARAFGGDRSWVGNFLSTVELPPKATALPPQFPADRLRPPSEKDYLQTEEVLHRLRGQFSYFQSIEHPQANAIAGPVARAENEPSTQLDGGGRYTIVAADDEQSTAYIRFELWPGKEILIGYRDIEHQAAVRPPIERCARLLGYNILVS